MSDIKEKIRSKIFSLQMSKVHEKSVAILAHLNICNIRQMGDKIVEHYIRNLNEADKDLFVELYNRTYPQEENMDWDKFFKEGK